MPFFAACAGGLESLLAGELQKLAPIHGLREAAGGVSFEAAPEQVWRLVLWSRLANRIFLQLHREMAATPDQLYQFSRSIPWEEHLHPHASIRVQAHARRSTLNNSLYLCQLVKDGIVDRLRDRLGRRPSVAGRDEAHAGIHLFIHQDHATLSLDLAGNLSRRLVRIHGGTAPLRETLAAALLMRLGWPAQVPLLDPFCGSGTFAIEAGWMRLERAPRLGDALPCAQQLQHFRPAGWKSLQEEALALHRQAIACEGAPFLRLSDIDPRVVQDARTHVARAGLERWAVVEQRDLHEGLPSPDGETWLIANPPYGVRLGAEAANLALYHQLGCLLKTWQHPWRLGLLSAEESLAQATRLKAERAWHFRNGSIPCRFYLFRSKDRPAIDAEASGEDVPAPSPGQASPRTAVGLPTAGLPTAGLPTAGLSPSLQAFLNRVRKNWRTRKKWASRQNLEAYRIYDADLPDFNLVLELFGTHLVVGEYQAPKEIPEEKAQRRLHDALLHLPPLLEIPPTQVWLKKRRRQLSGEQYRKAGEEGLRVVVAEGAAHFWVNLSDYLDTGLFLDSRKVRQFLATRARGARLLNLFCYTGTATVQAALAGLAGSTSVDLSATYLDWAAANFQENGLDLSRHHLVRSDVSAWLEEDSGRYELIYLDPPTFSNSKGLREDFDLQRDHSHLLQSCLNHLTPGGLLIFVHHFTGFQMEWVAPGGFSLKEVTPQMTPEDFARRCPSRVWLIEAPPA